MSNNIKNKQMNYKVTEQGDNISCLDIENGIIVSFQKGKFNETQKTSTLGGERLDLMKAARAMAEITDYLLENHKELL